MNALSPRELRRALIAAIRTDFPSFVRKVFNEVVPGGKFLPNWHVEAICHQIEKTLTGNHRRLIINMPPRYMKSLISSIALPAWLLGHDPARSIICVSYNDELAKKFSRDFRRVVESPWYREAFPKMRLDPKKISETEVTTTQNGSRLATSVRGTLTGRGGNFIIIDDPIRLSDGESESERNFVNEWFDTTVLSRLNDKENGVIILVMQRVHEHDLAGHLLEKPDWQQLSLPAIATENQAIEIGPDRVYNRISGEALHAGLESLDSLNRTRLHSGSRLFSALYQQQPVPAEGAMIKAVWLKTSPKDFKILPGDRVYQSWDVAAKAGTGNDWSVGTTWAVRDREIHLISVLRARLEFPDLLRAVVAQASAYNPIAVLIEDTSAGTAVLQLLESTSKLNVIAIKVSGDKIARAVPTTAMFEAGRFHLPSEADWLAEYSKELLAFPGGRYDDQVDATSQFLNWLAENERNQLPIFEIWSMPREDRWWDFSNRGF
jgi:predicted phage terminase large subunit-like protein